MDPANPWSFDPFNPPNPGVHAPAPRAHTPKLIPEEERLYQVQRNAMKVLQDIDALSRLVDSHTLHSAEWHRLLMDAENTYRVIRSWLTQNTQPGGGYA